MEKYPINGFPEKDCSNCGEKFRPAYIEQTECGNCFLKKKKEKKEQEE